MPEHKETYQGSLTRGMISPRDSRADMVFHVTGLDGARGSLDDAITEITGGLAWLVHPDDLTIPLRTATATWIRGADGIDNAEALVYLTFDKRGSGEAADATEFSNIADVDVEYEVIEWWGDTLDSTFPFTVTLKSDPRGGNAAIELPAPNYITVPIMHIRVPVVLSSSPISTIIDTVGKTNDTAKTLSGKSFAANTIRNNGLRQRAVKIDDGSSVTYEFGVHYSFSIRRDGWRRSFLEDNGSGGYRANVGDIYARTTFPTFPV